MTPFETKCELLSDLWLGYRYEDDFLDFVKYCDLGLPLSYLIHNEIVKVTSEAELLVNETFDVLLEGLQLEDTGFENLEELLDLSLEE